MGLEVNFKATLNNLKLQMPSSSSSTNSSRMMSAFSLGRKSWFTKNRSLEKKLRVIAPIVRRLLWIIWVTSIPKLNIHLTVNTTKEGALWLAWVLLSSTMDIGHFSRRAWIWRVRTSRSFVCCFFCFKGLCSGQKVCSCSSEAPTWCCWIWARQSDSRGQLARLGWACSRLPGCLLFT